MIYLELSNWFKGIMMICQIGNISSNMTSINIKVMVRIHMVKRTLVLFLLYIPSLKERETLVIRTVSNLEVLTCTFGDFRQLIQTQAELGIYLNGGNLQYNQRVSLVIEVLTLNSHV